MAKHILEDANKTNGSIPAAMVEDAEWIFDVDGSSKLTWTHVKFELPGTPTLLGLDTDKKDILISEDDFLEMQLLMAQIKVIQRTVRKLERRSKHFDAFIS